MSPADPLAAFPPAVRDAHARWQNHRDLAALDTVVLAILAYHRPRRDPAATDILPDSANLKADLGYDSLALAEVVFFVEDLFGVTISNADLATLATVADLRAYVRAKVAA
ncbi:MAG: acyl carrier protein [Burkholderiales bacterium]|nr:acyl carrier protein [Opitutaceae bacterium]